MGPVGFGAERFALRSEKAASRAATSRTYSRRDNRAIADGQFLPLGKTGPWDAAPTGLCRSHQVFEFIIFSSLRRAMARSLLIKVSGSHKRTRPAVSSAVAETSSHVSSQSARQKSGQGSQSAGSDGFSGLVDSNLSAADGSEQAPRSDQPRTAARELQRGAAGQAADRRSPAIAGPGGVHSSGIERKCGKSTPRH